MCIKVESCCCCIGLEVGAQVISIVTSLLTAAMALLYGITAALLWRQDSRILFYAVMSAASACHCFMGCLLACGAFLKKPRLMWPWLVLAWCESGLLLALSITGSVLLLVRGDFDITTDTNAVISAYIIYSLLLFYCTCVVNSRRAQLAQEQAHVHSGKRRMRPTATAWKYV